MSRATRHTAAIKSPRKHKKYSIIIPAAGTGERMLTYGAKPLIKLNNNETVISRQLAIIDGVFPQHEVILVTGFQDERVRANTPTWVKKITNIRYQTTNVVASIGVGLTLVSTNNVVIIYGDLVFNEAILQAPFDTDSMAIICNTMQSKEIGCTLDHTGRFVQHMFYNLPNKWGQILYLKGQELHAFRELSWSLEGKRLFGFEAINQIIDQGGKIKAHIPKGGRAIDIDTSKDIPLAKQI